MAKDKSKYKSKKIEIDGIKFDSKAEGDYYLLLKKYKETGTVKDFELQPKFVLQEKFKHRFSGNIRSLTYTADFKVVVQVGQFKIIYVVDVKGKANETSPLKRKLFLNKYPNIDLRWISKSLKHGDSDGWIDYFELQKIRRENRKKKTIINYKG